MNPDSPTPADRMLAALKRLAPVGTRELATALDLTVEATRQQIHRLIELGWVEGRQQPADGVGRPRQVWRLTAEGQRRFPDAHALMTVQLIESVAALFGQDGLDQLIARREAASRERYQRACTAEALAPRLRQLAKVRSEEGYMARVEREGDALLLIEDHCPICAAASACQGFCRSEQALFERTDWKRVWGVPPELYAGIFRFARDKRVPLRALLKRRGDDIYTNTGESR